MSIYDHISDALGIRNIFKIYPNLDPEELYAIPEDAVFGWVTGSTSETNQFKGMKHSEETKAKMRKPKSEETKAKMRKPKPNTSNYFGNTNALKKHPIVTCPHCRKQGGGGSMKRWHFDNCKHLNKEILN
jgi:hypothetical protein